VLPHLAESVKHLVEVDEYLTLGHLCDVVHALACIVPNSRILIAEAREDRGHDFFKIASYFLLPC
jgi:hypothetical protein